MACVDLAYCDSGEIVPTPVRDPPTIGRCYLGFPRREWNARHARCKNFSPVQQQPLSLLHSSAAKL
jgi:hypothetical protein